MPIDDSKEILQDFITESSEILEELENDLVELEEKKEDIELLNKIFRAVHTIKGSSSFLELDKIATISHHSEDILNKLRKQEMIVTDDIMNVLLEYVDLGKGIIRDLKTGKDTVNIDSLLDKLENIRSGKAINIDAGGKERQERAAPKTVLSQIRAATQAIEQTIRVEIGRLDALMNLVGELVLSRNRLVQISGDLSEKYEDDPKIEQLIETTSQLGLITTELQLAVMKTRMIPISKVFNRFPRMIRDLARDLNKEVELVITGEDTELDKSVIELITDPLVHMVRNAIDHGIELPDEREKVGKSRKGTVRLNAVQEGNHIVIEVKDDGKGIDPNLVIKTALEKEVLTREEIARMEKDEILGLIFRPGFSTAKNVTNISGRGVGLDVVRSNVEKINGIINIDSKIGEGSLLQLKLPLTLAIIQSLLVEVSGEVFAIPLVSIIETIKIKEDELHSLEGREVLNYRTGVLSLIRIADVFNLEPTYSSYVYVVIIAVAEKQVGFIVDRLIGQEEIVIKSLGDYLSGLVGIAGATIMGDGKVRLIIDPSGTIEIASKMPRKIRKKKIDIEKDRNKREVLDVLVVDDSATDRKILKNLLNSIGWINTTEVASGKDAIEVIKHKNFEVAIVDLIMPEIDGYALAKYLRESEFKKPLIAITARGETADEKQLKMAGFDKLVLKPINLSEILNIIDELSSKSHTV
jgi:two-component system chemotaxis sensor kinase CheA